MRIISYEFSDDTWTYTPIFLKRTNLLVGASGSGKTKFLNTIFNLASFIRKNDIPREGNWKIQFSIGARQYIYEYSARRSSPNLSPTVVHERLAVVPKGKKVPTDLILRTSTSMKFNGQELPRLLPSTSGINLLQEEPKIRPVYDAFGRILRRNFFADALNSAMTVPLAEESALKGLDSLVNKYPMAPQEWPLAIQLWYLKNNYDEKFKLLLVEFQSIFPHILSLTIALETDKSQQFPGRVLVSVMVKEKGVKPKVPLHELSSGMQKVLMIMCDALLMPKEGIYLIDEYENSLGINAINFLPAFISEYAKDMQLLVTTHHEYLINKMPVQNWLLFSRKGADVTIRDGADLREKYKTSRQDSFTQLINDPLYSMGPQ